MAETSYLNTDLELSSDEALDALAAFFESKEWSVHFADWRPEGYWFGAFEEPLGHQVGPEQAIGAMLDLVGALPHELAGLWKRCSKRDFNIGYQGGIAPHAFEQSLSAELLARVAAARGSVRITVYACEGDARPPQ